MAKTVLITGASRGIGKCVAQKLAKEGFSTILAARDLDALNTVQKELTVVSPNQSHKVLELDLLKFTSADAWTCKDPVHALVNSAGIASTGLLMKMSPDQLAKCFQVNTTGPILLTKALLRPMMRQGGGDFIYLSSVLASKGWSGMSAYGASKAAIQSFSRSMAREMGTKGLRFNTISPGLVDTDMGRAANIEELLGLNITKELIDPEDVANAVLFLLKTKSVNGTDLCLDNGMKA